jgi:hypothetical protein
MPTGYTADIVDHDVTFNEFVLGCSRAMGPFFHMRDDSSGAELRLPSPPSNDDYHAVECRKAEREIELWTNRDATTCTNLAFCDHEIMKQENKDARVKARDINGRLSSMLRKVKGWMPPTANHEGLRDFMVQQLESEIKYEGSPHLQTVPTLDGEEFRAAKIAEAQRMLSYHSRYLGEDQERYESQCAWIEALGTSLGVEIGK